MAARKGLGALGAFGVLPDMGSLTGLEALEALEDLTSESVSFTAFGSRVRRGGVPGFPARDRGASRRAVASIITSLARGSGR